MTFYERLLKLLGKKGVTNKEFLEAVGFGRNQMSHWKSGDPPTPRTLKALSDYFNVSVKYLTGESDDDSPRFASVEVVTFDELGTVRAGFDGRLDGTPTGRKIEIPASELRGYTKDDFFTLRVEGDSMYPRLLEGDTLLCLRCDSVDSGSIAIVMYGNEDATVKKVNYVFGEDWLELVPFNPEYKVKRIEGSDLQYCRVLGKVIRLIRDM